MKSIVTYIDVRLDGIEVITKQNLILYKLRSFIYFQVVKLLSKDSCTVLSSIVFEEAFAEGTIWFYLRSY